MKKFFFLLFILAICLVSCTSTINEDALAVETQEETVADTQDTIEVKTTPAVAPSDEKMRINLEESHIAERFPYCVMEGDIEIYYSDRVPQEMLDTTISLINSTTDSKVISQLFLDTQYDPELDTSNKAYSFLRNVMFIVNWDDDPKYSMFNRYFYHELGHLLLGEYMHKNGLDPELELPFNDEWVPYFNPVSLQEDFATFYEYYRAWPDILDIYVEYDGVGPSVDIMKEVISSFY